MNNCTHKLDWSELEPAKWQVEGKPTTMVRSAHCKKCGIVKNEAVLTL